MAIQLRHVLSAAALLFAVNCASAIVIEFTGDVYNDYTLTNANADVNVAWFGDFHNDVTIENNPTWANEINDVGVPSGITNRSGWDIRSVYFAYDRPGDFMGIGIDCYTICGDADGDGFENAKGTVLDFNGGDDKPRLTSSETFIVMLDLVNPEDDGVFDPELAIGWDASIINPDSEFGLWNFLPTGKFSPPGGLVDLIAWDLDVLYPNLEGCAFFNHPTAGALNDPRDCANAVDIELAINNFSDLPGFGTIDPVFSDVQIKFNIFSGSLEDDGVGEDNIPNPTQPIYYVWPGCDPDVCGLCPGESGFGLGVDECSYCPQNEFYGVGKDSCDLCPLQFGYENSEDECGECFGNGVDSCLLCPDDERFGTTWCWGCDDTPFSGLIYDECEVCDGDGSSCCEIESYKGYLPWELDLMLTYYTLVRVHDDLCWTVDVLEESFDLTYNYWWYWQSFEVEPLPFCDWLDVIWYYQECMQWLNLDQLQYELDTYTYGWSP